MSTPIPNGNIARIPNIQGADSLGNPETVHPETATIDDYTTAYVSTDGGGGIFVAPRPGAVAAGATKTVNVSIKGTATDGSQVTPLVFTFDVQGPPPPPPATHFTTGAVVVAPGGNITDPGTATITLA